jgi:aspartate-semialdehyde dehydrogenase
MVKKIAVVGATGNVGVEMLSILAERKFPVEEVVALASENSKGKEISFGSKKLTVGNLADYDFNGTELALFSAGADVSEIYGKKAADAGCVIIDNGSFYRMDKDIPLVVPEVNPQDIALYKNRNIIANPNCSTIQMVVALKPLHERAKIKRVVVSSYQAVSGAGKEAIDELYDHSKKFFENEKNVTPIKFKKSIPFNVIPQIDIPLDDGNYKEEWKMIEETKKILDKNIKVSATCVRVPVFAAHSESVNIEFENPISAENAREILSKTKGITVIDDAKNYLYAVPREVAGKDDVYVSRIRKDSSVENGLNLWVVADNIRKGAALNAVQIAEILVNKYGF